VYGYRVLFTTAANLIAALTKAHAEGRLDEKLKVYTTPRLPLAVEMGYGPIDRIGANLFFQLISRRHERGQMIPSSDQSFGAYSKVLRRPRHRHRAPGPIAASGGHAEHSLKEKLKACLVRAADDNSQPGGEI
jgi:DNA replication protein DnaC